MASPGSDIHERTSSVQVNATSESYYRCQLQEWKDLARWRQDNKYIISGYRTPSGSFWKSLESLTHIHNETVNVYSHLLGGFLFLGLFFYVLWKINQQYTTIRHVDYIVFVAFFVGIITCFFLSAFFHTIANHSETVAARGVQLDYAGIVLLMWGAVMPSIYYGFYCDPKLQKVYWIVLSSVAFGYVLVTFNRRLQSSQLRPYRAVMYTALGVSATIPIVHGVLIHGWEIQNKRISFTYVFLTAGLDLVAAVIYSIRFPERWHPIRFDIYGQSHQLLHVIVVLAGLIYLVGLLRAVSFAHSQRGQCV
jgi:adiponectin receptor